MSTPREWRFERDDDRPRRTKRGTKDPVNPGAAGMEPEDRARLLEKDRAMRETLSKTIHGRTGAQAGRVFSVTALPGATRGADGIATGVRVRANVGGRFEAGVEVTFVASDGTIGDADRQRHAGPVRRVTVKTNARGVAELVGWRPERENSVATAFLGSATEISLVPPSIESDESE